MTATATHFFYTTAPKAYDGFSTRELIAAAGTYRGQPVRLIAVDKRDRQWQTTRYASGSHCALTPAEFAANVAAGMFEAGTTAEAALAAARDALHSLFEVHAECEPVVLGESDDAHRHREAIAAARRVLGK